MSRVACVTSAGDLAELAGVHQRRHRLAAELERVGQVLGLGRLQRLVIGALRQQLQLHRDVALRLVERLDLILDRLDLALLALLGPHLDGAGGGPEVGAGRRVPLQRCRHRCSRRAWLPRAPLPRPRLRTEPSCCCPLPLPVLCGHGHLAARGEPMQKNLRRHCCHFRALDLISGTVLIEIRGSSTRVDAMTVAHGRDLCQDAQQSNRVDAFAGLVARRCRAHNPWAWISTLRNEEGPHGDQSGRRAACGRVAEHRDVRAQRGPADRRGDSPADPDRDGRAGLQPQCHGRRPRRWPESDHRDALPVPRARLLGLRPRVPRRRC